MTTLQPHDVAYNNNRINELIREQTIKLPNVDHNGQPINESNHDNTD
jgi:hypothetical protein